MPITFGSVGDIISLSLLIKDLVKCLDNSRGSPAEYQAVIRELWSLDYALLEVEVLFRSCDHIPELNALSATANKCAEQCRECVTKFQEQMKRFENSLHSGGSGSFIRDTTLKIRWQVSEKERLTKFRAEITAHCFSINMLLTTTGITITKLKDESLQTSLKQSEQSRTATQAYELAEIKSRLEENNALIKAAASETKEWGSRFDLNYFKNLGAELLSLMQRIWKVNILTYRTVISLQTSIPAQLERCWTQEPATLEDALGRITPVHLEFLDTWEAFEAVLEVRFRKLPGHRKIKQREYALRASFLERDVEQSLAFNRCFLPGQRIDMSMIFDGGSHGVSSCPGCKLVTSKTEAQLDSQVQCPRCRMWYQRVIETTSSESTPIVTTDPKAVAPDKQLPIPRPRKRQWIDDEKADDNPAQFRRVRLRYWGESQEPGSNLAPEQGGSMNNKAMPAESNHEVFGSLVRDSGLDEQLGMTRSSLSIAFLAEILQSEKGVRILSQRLYLRPYFIGSELTTWLLRNFKDVDTRDEAVELGNQLMSSGMFLHIERHQQFRDGQYFYQFADQYCAPRSESRPSRGHFERYPRSIFSIGSLEDAPEKLTTTSPSRADDSTSVIYSEEDKVRKKMDDAKLDAQRTGTGAPTQSYHSNELGSFHVPKFDSANLNSLSHPIGTSYMPNAQLLDSSDEGSDISDAELVDGNTRVSQSSQSTDGFAVKSSELGSSAMKSDPLTTPIDSLGSNGVSNDGFYDFANLAQFRYQSMNNSPRSESSKLPQIAAAFEKQGF